MTSALPVTIVIFDPPMCCATGLCGASIDPALLEISEAILKIRAEFDGRATVERYLLSQQPAKYTEQPEILDRLRAHGVTVLPISLVNGVVLKERCYPSYADMRRWIEVGDRECRERVSSAEAERAQRRAHTPSGI